jgi:hypothetical protein
MQIDLITPNYAYYKIVQLTLHYEYPTTLIFHKTLEIYIRKCCFSELFMIFKVFLLITIHNFMKIKIITPNNTY